MGAPNTGGVTVDVQRVREILTEIDRAAVSDDGKWADKRDAERRRVNVSCTIRYLAPDGKGVLTAEGLTRDISAGGLAFVSSQHFRRGIPLYIVVITGTGVQTRCLTGTVAYSRVVREGWYLTGVKFVPIDGKDLAPKAVDSESDQGVGELVANRPPDPPDVPGEHQPPDSPRERTLRSLASASSGGVISKAQIDRIIVLSASEDHVVRRATIPALMQITSPPGRLGLEVLLKDRNPQIQVEAAEALGAIGAKTVTESLKPLLSHEKPNVALRVAAVLGRLNDQSGLAAVRRYLAKDTPHTREAVRALGVIVGRKFRLNSDGIAEARCYLKKLKQRSSTRSH